MSKLTRHAASFVLRCIVFSRYHKTSHTPLHPTIMDPSTLSNLEHAKALCLSWRMIESYNIFKRYFDRIPFKLEKEHAEYVGYFTRAMVELGKDAELRFYVNALERHWDKLKTPVVAYQLAVMHAYDSDPRWNRVIELLEYVLRTSPDVPSSARAKMLLAYCHGRTSNIGALRPLIDSIDPNLPQPLERLRNIWQANVFRYEKKFNQAKEKLNEVLNSSSKDDDWYSYYSAKNIYAHLHLDEGNIDSAQSIHSELKKLFYKRNFKTVHKHLNDLEQKIRELSEPKELCLVEHPSGASLQLGNEAIELTKESPVDKLLLLLITKSSVSKKAIIQKLFGREYNGRKDDGQIYSMIHAIRKKLAGIGSTGKIVSMSKGEYCFLLPIQKAGAST